MKILDLPDEEDNPVRQLLLKQDDKTLEELANKSKQEIQDFLFLTMKKEKNQEAQKQNMAEQAKNQVDIEKEQKYLQLKSAFTKSVLDKNQDIAKMLETKDFD